MHNIYEQIYEIVKEIPFGKVTTYGAIAEKIGSRISAQLVGWALNSDRGNINMPYHRVVNRNGELTGRFNFPDENFMRSLLEAEGVTFLNDAVDMKNHFWKP